MFTNNKCKCTNQHITYFSNTGSYITYWYHSNIECVQFVKVKMWILKKELKLEIKMAWILAKKRLQSLSTRFIPHTKNQSLLKINDKICTQ